MQDSNESEVISSGGYSTPSDPVFGSNDGIKLPKSPKEKTPLPGKKKLLLAIAIVLVLVGGGIAGFFIYKNWRRSSENDTSVTITPGYSTPEGSEDPAGDYLEHLKSETSKAKSGIEKLSALAQEASQYISMGDASSAKELLDGIDEKSLKTYDEQYTYYNAYANLYAADGLNDPALEAEYRQKTEEIVRLMDEEALEQIRSENANS